MDPQERMDFDGSLTFWKDSSHSRSDTFMIISDPNKKGINTHEESGDQYVKRLINLYVEMLSSTETKLKNKSLFKQKKSKRGRKVPSKDN
jgi:hypothetical protein